MKVTYDVAVVHFPGSFDTSDFPEEAKRYIHDKERISFSYHGYGFEVKGHLHLSEEDNRDSIISDDLETRTTPIVFMADFLNAEDSFKKLKVLSDKGLIANSITYTKDTKTGQVSHYELFHQYEPYNIFEELLDIKKKHEKWPHVVEIGCKYQDIIDSIRRNSVGGPCVTGDNIKDTFEKVLKIYNLSPELKAALEESDETETESKTT